MRKYRRLTREDRITIERRLEQQKTQTEIADEIGVHRSSISREIRRNKSLHGPYRWRGAQAKVNSMRPGAFCYERKINGALEELIIQFLLTGLSPDQISRRLKLENSKWSISHESIYKWIYNVAPEYKICLRWKSRRRNKRGVRKRRALTKFPRKYIDERPAAANLRQECGHWERDLLEGRRGGPALLVIQDRVTRLTKIRKIVTKHADEINDATARALKGELVRSITNDNGVEFGQYEVLEKLLKAPVYYCHPYTSWERGSVENTNGLIRQFYPKHTDFTSVCYEDIQALENTINSRPRKTLGYRSAIEVHERKVRKLVRPENYYAKKYWERNEKQFRRSMIREVGFYLTKTRDGVVALEC